MPTDTLAHIDLGHGARLAGPLAVVAHDAGGAELVSSLLQRHRVMLQLPVRMALAGPALAVFRRKLGPELPLCSLGEVLDGAATLLAGSGWSSPLEWQAIANARAQGVPSVVMLDHWVNYRSRFMRHGRLCLPDALWTGDADALALARRQLPEVPALLLPNPYLADQLAALTALGARPRPLAGRVRVLYVTEPVCEPAQRQFGDPLHHGYTEQQALDWALFQLPLALGAAGLQIDSLVLRPHPSEPADKYDAQLTAWQARCGFALRRASAPSLAEALADSDVVVGCHSMAMALALAAGRRVYCAIPPGGPACALPQQGIQRLGTVVPFVPALVRQAGTARPVARGPGTRFRSHAGAARGGARRWRRPATSGGGGSGRGCGPGSARAPRRRRG